MFAGSVQLEDSEILVPKSLVSVLANQLLHCQGGARLTRTVCISLSARSVFQVSWLQHKSFKIFKLPLLKRCTQPLYLCSADLHALQCFRFSLLTNCTFKRFLALLMGSEANTELSPSISSAYQVLLLPSLCCGKGLGCQEL